MECHLIDERITRLVSLFMASLNRANVRAFPVESGDIGRSRIVSWFLKVDGKFGVHPTLLSRDGTRC